MKTLLLASFLLLPSFADAYEGFRCIPSLRETRIQVLVKDENIEVLVVNPSGYKFMPQFSSPASVFNLAFFKMQGEDLSLLGDAFIFSWPKDKCELDSDNFVINCNGEALLPVNTVNSYGVSTTEITEKYQGEVFEKRRYRLSVEKDNLYFVTFEYYSPNCAKF